MSDLHLVILAAGKGTRMKSSRPKVLHATAGLPLIEHVLRAADPVGAATTIVVIGHGGDAVRVALGTRPNLHFATQAPQLGTGHALQQAAPVLSGKAGTVLMLSGDAPLVMPATLMRLVAHHRDTGAALTVLTAELDDPARYGRIVRSADGRVTRIVEARDATSAEGALREVNSGIYAFALEPLFPALRSLATDNAQGEYYLTDLIGAYHDAGRRVEAVRLDDPTEMLAVNNRAELADVGAVLRRRKSVQLMLDGVTLEDPANVYIDADVVIGADSVIGPGVVLTGRTSLGERCRIHAGVRISDTAIGDDVSVLDHSVIVQSTVAARASIGPFAHLRPKSLVAEGAHLGNFVELKNTRLGPRSKAGHLSYLGDAVIGADVNIGAGTITCNYDGVQKHQTTIEDGVFIGSDSQLVAPVTIGRGAYVAAGSSITENVPEDALAVARGRQINKPDWAATRRAKRRDEAR